MIRLSCATIRSEVIAALFAATAGWPSSCMTRRLIFSPHLRKRFPSFSCGAKCSFLRLRIVAASQRVVSAASAMFNGERALGFFPTARIPEVLGGAVKSSVSIRGQCIGRSCAPIAHQRLSNKDPGADPTDSELKWVLSRGARRDRNLATHEDQGIASVP